MRIAVTLVIAIFVYGVGITVYNASQREDSIHVAPATVKTTEDGTCSFTLKNGEIQDGKIRIPKVVACKARTCKQEAQARCSDLEAGAIVTLTIRGKALPPLWFFGDYWLYYTIMEIY